MKIKLNRDFLVAILVVVLLMGITLTAMAGKGEWHLIRGISISLVCFYAPLSILILHFIAKKKGNKVENQYKLWTVSFIILFVIIILFNCIAAIPTRTYTNNKNEIVLKTVVGSTRIPLSEITEQEIPQVQDGNVMSDLVRTNGFSAGSRHSGYFENRETGQEFYLFLCGKEVKRCFEYKGLVYIIDDWQSIP